MAEFKQLIENDPEVHMLFAFMLQQVPYQKTPTHEPQVKTVDQMLRLFNYIMTHAPEYNDTGLVGFPINAILDWAMGTEAGFAAFLNKRVNRQFKKLLNEWGIFLKSADSASVLNDTAAGWFGPDALANMPNFAAGLRMRSGPAALRLHVVGRLLYPAVPPGRAAGGLARRPRRHRATPASRRPTG